MHLFEAILEANHRAVGGDPSASVRVADFEAELPIVVLTCVDARLNALFPNVLGVRGEQLIWLRNAGNIITGPMSSTMRSLSLACAVKGGKEIAIIGHTDCQVGRTSTMQLLDKLKALGIDRHLLPENLTEFFGMFGSDRQNVIKACDFARRSPLIGPKVPVHGLLVDIATGKLESVVNGYQSWETMDKWNELVKSAGQTTDALRSLADFQIGEMKFPETKIGEAVTKAEDWLSKKLEQIQMAPAVIPHAPESAMNAAKDLIETVEKHWPAKPVPPKPLSPPPRMPQPPPVRPSLQMHKPK